tara:strand:- start:14 stop:163 length:150 start_codon:yes stop_codon:yes gene_type:complete
MSELQESIIRERVILLLDRNRDKTKRIINRFLKCVKGEFDEAKKIINET